MATPKVDIVVRAKDQASKELQGITGHIQGMSKQLKMAGIAMVAAGTAITAALGMAMKAAAEEEAGVIRLTVAMKNMGLSYEDTKDSLEAWIDMEQQKTSIADDAQRDALASLIRMTGDMEKAQDMLTLAMDVGVGTGRDLESANKLIMYAMGGNWGMLERYIPALKAAEDEEAKWILLRKMFAGQAEAYGQTMAGQMDLLKNNIGDIKETIGGFIIEAIAPLVEKVQDTIRNIKAWAAEHPQLMKTIVIVTGVIGLLLIPLGTLLIMLPMLAAGIGTLGTVLTFATGPIGIVILAVMALIAVGILLWKNWDKVKLFFIGMWITMKNAVKDAWEAISGFVQEHWDKILAILFPAVGLPVLIARNWSAIKAKTVEVWSSIVDFFEWVWNTIVRKVTDAWNKIVGFFGWVWEKIKDIFMRIGESIYAPIKWAVDGAIGLINKLIRAISKIPFVDIKEIGWRMPEFPEYQRGVASVPETGLALVHRGETILPSGRPRIQAPLILELSGEPVARAIIELVGGELILRGA